MAPLLVFGYGNPSRGDDALGPLLVQALQSESTEFGGHSEIEFLTDFQLQIEHALDLADRQLVLFADAHVSCTPPFRFERLAEERDSSYTSHAMSPSAVMHVYRRTCRSEPPPTFLLSLRGERFELGGELSSSARANLAAAIQFANVLLQEPEPSRWLSFCVKADG